MAKKLKAVVGLTLADGTRIEPGETVPPEVVEAAPWLLEQGAVK